MMLMMMPYYEFHDCIDTLDSGRSERNVACTEAGGGGHFDHVTATTNFPTITSSSAKLLAQSFNPLSLSLVNHLSVCSHIHPSVLGDGEGVSSYPHSWAGRHPHLQTL
jgi:hypothetical protein